MSRLSRPAWLTTGLLIGVIVVPATAFAAATVVTISGGGHTASVTPAGQLRTVEFDPVYNFHLRGGGGNNGTTPGCVGLGTPQPSTRAAIIKQINVDTYYLASGTTAARGLIFTGSNCDGSLIAEADSDAIKVDTLPLGNGVAIPANTPLSLQIGPGGGQTINVYGYTVTRTAVPAAAARRIGPANPRDLTIKKR